MSDYAEKLIGGWVAGTLTPEERAVLLDASMKNQALFDAMADEEGMRELLADPVVRRELAAVLAAKGAVQRAGWWQRLFKPGPMAAFSAGVLAVVAFVVIRPETAKQRAEQAIVAEVPAGSAGNASQGRQANQEKEGASPRPRRVLTGSVGNIGRATGERRRVTAVTVNRMLLVGTLLLALGVWPRRR
jgi:hypothetical protein